MVICSTVHRQWSSLQQYTDNGHLFNSTQTMVICSAVHKHVQLFNNTQTRSNIQQYTDTVKCSTIHRHGQVFNSTYVQQYTDMFKCSTDTGIVICSTVHKQWPSVQQYTDNGHLFNSTQIKVICLTVHRQWSSFQQYTDNRYLFNSTQTIVTC